MIEPADHFLKDPMRWYQRQRWWNLLFPRRYLWLDGPETILWNYHYDMWSHGVLMPQAAELMMKVFYGKENL
jgi:hypothetical protein